MYIWVKSLKWIINEVNVKPSGFPILIKLEFNQYEWISCETYTTVKYKWIMYNNYLHI